MYNIHITRKMKNNKYLLSIIQKSIFLLLFTMNANNLFSCPDFFLCCDKEYKNDDKHNYNN